MWSGLTGALLVGERRSSAAVGRRRTAGGHNVWGPSPPTQFGGSGAKPDEKADDDGAVHVLSSMNGSRVTSVYGMNIGHPSQVRVPARPRGDVSRTPSVQQSAPPGGDEQRRDLRRRS